MPLCVSLIIFLSVLVIDRLSARQFVSIYKFICMFLSVCMFVHLYVRVYANFCVRFLYCISLYVCLSFHRLFVRPIKCVYVSLMCVCMPVTFLISNFLLLTSYF